MSYPAYTPLQEVRLENQYEEQQAHMMVPQPTQTTEPSSAEILLMRRSAQWIILLSLVQLLFGFLALFSGGLLIMIITAIFVPMGIVGTIKRRPRLLVAHFAYSLALYILTLVGIIAMIIYCSECTVMGVIFGFVFLIIQAIGLRHSRILIGYTRLYPNYVPACPRRCASRCNQQQACAPQQQQAMEPVAPQQPVVMPQYYPVVAVPPQAYAAQMRYPALHPQGYPIIPMGMQPYVMPAFPQPTQDNQSAPQQQQQAMYPAVPVVYRQI